jgi:hypothetical protein
VGFDERPAKQFFVLLGSHSRYSHPCHLQVGHSGDAFTAPDYRFFSAVVAQVMPGARLS